MEKPKVNIAEFFETLKVDFNKCLWPTLACNEKAINAHSVQNASSLALISEKNHVAALGMRINGGSLTVYFQKSGAIKLQLLPVSAHITIPNSSSQSTLSLYPCSIPSNYFS